MYMMTLMKNIFFGSTVEWSAFPGKEFADFEKAVKVEYHSRANHAQFEPAARGGTEAAGLAAAAGGV